MKQKKIKSRDFETFIFCCCNCPMEMAKEEGPYSSYEGCQFLKENSNTIFGGLKDEDLSGRWDWASLQKRSNGKTEEKLIVSSANANGFNVSNFRKNEALNLTLQIFIQEE